MKRGLLSALSLAVLAAATWSCGSKEAAPAPEAAAPKKLRFAVLPKSLDIPVFNYAKIGAEREAKALGNVEVIWRAAETADQLKQKEILESFISQRVDGIAISTTNGDFLTETIDRAVAAGIPVVTWDADAPKSKRAAYYGVDDFAAGQVLGEETVKMLGPKKTVAIITSLGAYNLQRRLEGVQDSLKKHPEVKVVEVFDIKEDSVRCVEVIATATNKYPDLGAWISVGGWPVFTRNALDPVDPKKTKFASFDTIPPAPDVMRAGKVQLLIGQKYFGWGSESVKLLAGIKAGKMPEKAIIDSGVDIVTPANLDQYVADWAKLEKE